MVSVMSVLLRRQLRSDGASLPAGMAQWLADLADASQEALRLADDTGILASQNGPAEKPKLDVWVTAKAAADAVGLGPERVRQLAKARTIRGRKMGRDWLVDCESLRQHLRLRR